MSKERVANRFLIALGLGSAILSTSVAPGQVGNLANLAKQQPTSYAPVKSTCFDDQIGGRDADRIARSTVLLVSLSSEGVPLKQGSGVIVADSALSASGFNRILTAAHILNIRENRNDPDVPEAASVLVIGSDGRSLGSAQAVAVGTHDISRSYRNDEAVLDMYLIEDPKAYRGIPGLPLGAQDSSGFVQGHIDRPAGVDGGVSGGPGTSRSGAILGLVQSRIVPDTTVKLSRPLLYDIATKTPTSDPVTPQEFITSSGDEVFLVTVTSPPVLAQLNRAASKITSGHIAPQPVTITGATRGYCIAYSGTVESLKPGDAHIVMSTENLQHRLTGQIHEFSFDEGKV